MLDLLEIVKEEDLPADQRDVSVIIGLESYKKLVRAYGGIAIYIQKPEKLTVSIRNNLIRNEFSGDNHKVLAKKYGLTEQWVRCILNEKMKEYRNKPFSGQTSLFDS